MSAPRALLAGLVDYAGLFPPAGLDMATAVRNYAGYRAGDHAWMLGRFVAPVARLNELSDALTTTGCDTSSPWRLTGLLGAEADLEREVARAHEHNAQSGDVTIDSLEARTDTPAAIRRLASAACSGGRTVTAFAEIPLDGPEPLIAAIAHAELSAEIRTGGVTADAIPAPDAVLRALKACTAAGVPVKATAGLHHPIRGEYALTYDPAAPRATMFGFLNVFLAAAFLRHGLDDADALRLLEERDPRAFEFDHDSIRWRSNALSAAQVRDARDAGARSFGSCSFREPVDDLRALAWLPLPG